MMMFEHFPNGSLKAFLQAYRDSPLVTAATLASMCRSSFFSRILPLSPPPLFLPMLTLAFGFCHAAHSCQCGSGLGLLGGQQCSAQGSGKWLPSLSGTCDA